MTESIEASRSEIDQINQQIISLLTRRAELADKICDQKAQDGEAVRDKDREKEILDHVKSVAESEGASSSMVHDVFKTILEHSVVRQRRRRGGGEGPEY